MVDKCEIKVPKSRNYLTEWPFVRWLFVRWPFVQWPYVRVAFSPDPPYRTSLPPRFSRLRRSTCDPQCSSGVDAHVGNLKKSVKTADGVTVRHVQESYEKR